MLYTPIVRGFLVCLFVLIISSPSTQVANAQNFRSSRARAAAKDYHNTMLRARRDYLKKLKSAEVTVTKDGDLNEALRIKRAIALIEKELVLSDRTDKLYATEQAVGNSRYTWNRTNDPDQLSFESDGTVSTNKVNNGAWQVIEPGVVILKLNSTLFMLKLDDSFQTFKVLAFEPTKTLYQSGRRIKK